MEILGFPYIDVRNGMTLFQLVQHICPSIAPTRSPDFPKVGHGHILEICPRNAQFRSVKDWFATHEFGQDLGKLRIGSESRFHLRNHDASIQPYRIRFFRPPLIE
jgi:hypothetical protein